MAITVLPDSRAARRRYEREYKRKYRKEERRMNVIRQNSDPTQKDLDIEFAPRTEIGRAVVGFLEGKEPELPVWKDPPKEMVYEMFRNGLTEENVTDFLMAYNDPDGIFQEINVRKEEAEKIDVGDL